MADNQKLVIFDTTLRDGEQCPGASMSTREKLEVAHALSELNVDVIEAGFPIASPGDFEAVNKIAKEVKGPVLCGLARASSKDIDAAAEALKPSERFRIHTFIATSEVHMKNKLRLSPEAVIEKAISAVKHARKFTQDVEFSAEDAGRSSPEFLTRVIEAVIDAGATTINIPDTVGYTIPMQYGELISTLIKNTPNSDKAIFSTHCHNDLGLAVANSLYGVLNGARQVECTINGIGERAGNAALEEVVMAIRTRPDVFPVYTDITTEKILGCSRLVSSATDFVVQKNKAIVGENAFAHEAGIHQDGILKERTTYEIMLPQHVGWESSQMVLGKHSGRNALSARLKILGAELSGEVLDKAFSMFKELADKKKVISDADLKDIISKLNMNND